MAKGEPIGDLSNKTFEKLTVLHRLDCSSKSGVVWVCKCDCGNTTTATSSVLLRGKKTHCGCSKKSSGVGRCLNKKYGYITPVEDITSGQLTGVRLYKCLCVCGAELTLTSTLLRYKNHCGCMADVVEQQRRDNIAKHRMSYTPTYDAYNNMKRRCVDKNSEDYKHYGGRGISICPRWLGDGGFINFFNDMGEKPRKKSLDRIDTNGDYSPDNCRWVGETVQNYNQRTRVDNSSGTPGVSYNKQSNMWIARLWMSGELVHYSKHNEIEDAIKQRLDAEIEYYGFSKNTKT